MLDERRRAGHAATRKRPHARRELRELEGLGEVVVGPGIQSAYAVVHAVERREHEHGQARVARSQALQDLESAELRQRDVEDQQIELARIERRIGLAAVLGPVDRIARLPQRAAQRVREYGIVFGDQNAHGPPPCATAFHLRRV